MPDYPDPFSGNSLGRKLSEEELVRAIRFAIMSEYEAITAYDLIAESSDDERAKKVFEDISREERIHSAEFLALLKKIRPEESDELDEGEQEVEGILKNSL